MCRGLFVLSFPNFKCSLLSLQGTARLESPLGNVRLSLNQVSLLSRFVHKVYVDCYSEPDCSTQSFE